MSSNLDEELFTKNGRLLVRTGPDRGAILHFGDPVKEQRALAAGTAWADLSHLEIVAIKGSDRLRWLHDLTTQHVESFSGGWTNGLILDHLGHIEHQFLMFDDGETSWLIVDVDRAAPLIDYLKKMQFTMRVEVRDASNEKSLIRITGFADDLGGPFQLVERGAIPDFSNIAGATQVGIWALEAERVAAMRPRIGLETDHKSIPNEINLLNKSVHLNKGCYRGQETVAKVHNLGQPPRKLVLLHLDGSEIDLPPIGADLEREGVKVGFVGTVARHYELGNIALAVVKRNVDSDAKLNVGNIAVSIN